MNWIQEPELPLETQLHEENVIRYVLNEQDESQTRELCVIVLKAYWREQRLKERAVKHIARLEYQAL